MASPSRTTNHHGLAHHDGQKQCVFSHSMARYDCDWGIEFLNAIRSVNPPQKWKILVVDEHSQALLNHVLKQFDILEENVTRMCNHWLSRVLPSHMYHVVIEAITNWREPQPSMEAIYLVMPTSQNVDRIIRDFSDGRRQYGAAHLFFIDGMYVSLCTHPRRACLTTALCLRATGAAVRETDVVAG